MGGVELGDPLRGLEDHGVALDEAALVAQPAALVTLLGELPRGLGRHLQLLVDPVHERLLASDLALDQLAHSTMRPLSTMSGPGSGRGQVHQSISRDGSGLIPLKIVTTSTDTESDRPDPGSAPSVVRRRRGTSNKKRRRVMLVGGIALITVGAIVLGWLAWQFWGTNWVSKGRQAEVVADLQEEWSDGQGTVETDFGKATGIIRIPRFGADYEVPILEGTTDEVLAAGVGHVEDTASVG